MVSLRVPLPDASARCLSPEVPLEGEPGPGTLGVGATRVRSRGEST